MNQEYAFPQSLQAGDRAQSTGGLKLRDYFAAQAMQVVPQKSAYNMRDSESDERYMARRAYAFADAMLAERAKGASNG